MGKSRPAGDGKPGKGRNDGKVPKAEPEERGPGSADPGRVQGETLAWFWFSDFHEKNTLGVRGWR